MKKKKIDIIKELKKNKHRRNLRSSKKKGFVFKYLFLLKSKHAIFTRIAFSYKYFAHNFLLLGCK